MVSIHNYEKAFARTLERVRDAHDISPTNKKHILGFKTHLQSEGIGIAKINRYIFDLLKFNRLLKKPFEKATKEDIRRVISELYATPLSEETRRCFKIMVRKLYCYLRGFDEKGIYPEEVKWMNMTINQKHSKLPEELLTEEEIRTMIQRCMCIRDKALIAVLAESGCRVSEIGMLQIKHIVLEPYGARLTVTGKTGARKILVITSTPYLQEWINSHPDNTNSEAYVWIHPKTGLLTYNRITDILKLSAVRAGIKKRVHPHLLRHSRATQLASIMSDSQLKNYLGWTQSSRMAGIYVHMSGKDTDDAILSINHIQRTEIAKESPLKPALCLKCKTPNPTTHRFCKSCGFVLDTHTAEQVLTQTTQETDMSTLLASLLQDKEVVQLLQRKMGEVRD